MLIRADISYQVVGGTKFYDRAEIKDAIAYLITLVNPHVVGAFIRIVNSPRWGIGFISIVCILVYVNMTGVLVWGVVFESEGVFGLGSSVMRVLWRFINTIQTLKK